MNPRSFSRRDFLKTAGLAAAAALPGERILAMAAEADQQHLLSVNPKPLFDLSPYLYMQFMVPLGVTDTSVDAAWVEKMIQERADARTSKDWKRADEIRNELEKMNILLEDRPDGTVWKVG